MTKPDLRIVWNVKRAYESTTFTGKVCYAAEPDGFTDAGIRNPMDSDGDLARFADLTISAYGSDDTNMPEWFGMSVEYRETFAVDLRRAEIMVKEMRRLDKAMTKLDAQLGQATDLASYCARAALAIGCTDPRPFGLYSRELTMNGTHYKWTDVDGLRWAMDSARESIRA